MKFCAGLKKKMQILFILIRRANTIPIVQNMVVQSVIRLYKVQNSAKRCELTYSDILISGIVWCKVYPLNKPTPEKEVKQLGPENRLISQKIRYVAYILLHITSFIIF